MPAGHAALAVELLGTMQELQEQLPYMALGFQRALPAVP